MNGPKQILQLDAKKEVMFIQGTPQLIRVMEMADQGLLEDVKVFVIASKTYINYLEAYNRFNTDILQVYPFLPEEFFEKLDVPNRIKDELHLLLKANFYEELHLHTHHSFSLSATMEGTGFKSKIYKIMFPKETRSPEVEYLKYVGAVALFYSLDQPMKAKYTNRGSTDYNHKAFEKYIMKSKKMTERYFTMIYEWVMGAYVSKKVDSQKALVYVDTIEMATALKDWLEKKLANVVTVGRYCASIGDDYDEAVTVDLLVTTIKSFGTGYDLPNLLCVLMTTAINSPDTNEQVKGRLRFLKNYPDTTPMFYYMVCADIRKHVQYHENKKLYFSGKVKFHKSKFLSNVI